MLPYGVRPATAARLAGGIYLATLAAADFAEFYARNLVQPGAPQATALNLSNSEWLFRLGVLSDVLTSIAVVALAVLLYVLLRSVNPAIAVIAAFWRLAESAVFALITVTDFAALRLLHSGLRQLASIFFSVHVDGYLVGLLFFGFGSAAFAYLWFESRLIPRWLSILGMSGSALVALGTAALIVWPGLGSAIVPAYLLPIFVFEVSLGVWLLVRGVPDQPASPT